LQHFSEHKLITKPENEKNEKNLKIWIKQHYPSNENLESRMMEQKREMDRIIKAADHTSRKAEELVQQLDENKR
jgi:hypothetical protein